MNKFIKFAKQFLTWIVVLGYTYINSIIAFSLVKNLSNTKQGILILAAQPNGGLIYLTFTVSTFMNTLLIIYLIRKTK